MNEINVKRILSWKRIIILKAAIYWVLAMCHPLYSLYTFSPLSLVTNLPFTYEGKQSWSPKQNQQTAN